MAILTGDSSANLLNGTSGADEISGLGGNDTLNGLSGFDTLLGGLGSDLLDGGAGADSIVGESGNDKLVFDTADTVIDGGTGADRLQMTGLGASLDLTAIANDVISGVERVSLLGGGNNVLVLAAQDLLDLSDSSDRLLVRGNAADRVEADGSWNRLGNFTLGNETYARYVQGNATLWVDTDIDRSGIVLASLNVAALDGVNGFSLDGVDAHDHSGSSVASAGDVNGDGFDDLIIGAPFGSGYSSIGQSYVVFGTDSGFTSRTDLASLDGTNGFRLDGIDAGDRVGFSVGSAGDFNGDGFDDVIIGAYRGDPGGDSAAGESYVVFGRASGFTSSIDLATLNGTSGFRLDGIDVEDQSGLAVSGAGDVNGDGFDDLIIGARLADPGGDLSAGESYVVFGKASGFASSIDLATLDGTNGFRLEGIDAYDHSGLSVAAAGDVNGDGFDDLIVGAYLADPGGDLSAGESYVIFGKASGFASSIDLATLDGTNGFRLDGIDAYDMSGVSVASAGDVNGDGFNDLIVGAFRADPGGDPFAGESYVVFGKPSGFASSIDLATLDGTNGFRLNGVDYRDYSGSEVASAGDVNGDGFNDLIVGAPDADSYTGESYVVFGKASGFASSIDLASLDGTDGFRVDGKGGIGASVAAAGDVNGDGFDDLIIGASDANPGGEPSAGVSYVVFGKDFTGAVTHLGTSEDNSLTGSAAAETFVAGTGNDTIAGSGGADVFNAGAGNDLIRVSSATFRHVDGGSGTDTLAILGGGRTLDLTALANNKISGIERIDITGSGDNTLKLSALDLFDLSDTTNQLRVEGDSGDTVDLAENWIDGGAGAAYHHYTLGTATVLIENDIFVT